MIEVDRRFLKGIQLFNEERFFQCHEELEQLWIETSDEIREFYKGLIQAAVAFHHLKNGNRTGAQYLFHSSLGYLEKFRPKTLGLDVEKLVSDLNHCFKEYQSHDKSSRVKTKTFSIPKLKLLKY